MTRLHHILVPRIHLLPDSKHGRTMRRLPTIDSNRADLPTAQAHNVASTPLKLPRRQYQSIIGSQAPVTISK